MLQFTVGEERHERLFDRAGFWDRPSSLPLVVSDIRGSFSREPDSTVPQAIDSVESREGGSSFCTLPAKELHIFWKLAPPKPDERFQTVVK